MKILPLREAELESLSALARKSFQATYGPHNPPGLLKRYMDKAFSTSQLRHEWDDSANHFFLALDAREQLVGYCKLRAGEKPGSLSKDNVIELERIYVDPARTGEGIGRQLMDSACDKARGLGFDAIWLGVWSKNTRAIAFYERERFEKTESKIFMMDDDPQEDYVMVKELRWSEV